MSDINIIDIPLSAGEFMPGKFVKDTIYLHHTAGGHRPDWVVNTWDKDRATNGKRWRIATAFVVGGKSTRDGNADWDGKIVRCFPEESWAYHLAAKKVYNVQLDPKSIGIEICNYGYVTRSRDGRFFNYVNNEIPASDVYELKEAFRGHTFFHKYTDAQLEATRKLLIYLRDKFNIDLNLGLNEMLKRERPVIPIDLKGAALQQWLKDNNYLGSDGKPLKIDGDVGPKTLGALEKATKHPFETQDAAFYGQPGVWTHCNVRNDKIDCHPQPELIQMLKSL